ncbi:MAG: nucleotidyltransferase family protein [Thalassovita sp.]
MSVVASKPPALTPCGSAPHRAVLGILAIALGRPAYDGLIADLRNSIPEQIAAIANQSYGQTILASGLRTLPALQSAIPDDLVIYFTEMQRANGERNTQAITQLAEIAAILAQHGIPILALKGAADVLQPLHDIPAHRYISDLDILIPENQITHAARLLREAKGLPVADRDILPGAHHHLAQIIAPDWLFTVELHIQPGSSAVQSVLNGAKMLRHATPSGIPGLMIPTLEDRFLHHILHNMELRHDTAALHLRALADHLRYRAALHAEDTDRAFSRLDAVGFGAWQTDLTDLAQALNGSPAQPGTWTWRALSGFGTPDAARSKDTLFWMKRYARRFAQSGPYRRQLIGKLFSPQAWAEFIQFHRDRRNRFK